MRDVYGTVATKYWLDASLCSMLERTFIAGCNILQLGLHDRLRWLHRVQLMDQGWTS